jgi:Fe2+ or Zn2+ uptake regulation protein
MTEEQILQRLRAEGHRLTGVRRRLVGLILRAGLPLTADALYARVRAAGLRANLSTIYRNLATFCAIGWLESAPGANGERYYAARDEAEPQMSVLCLDCGELTSLSTTAAGPLNQAVQAMGFDAHTLRVTVAAHCEHVCARRGSV